jgi:hypothetical protein
VCVLVYLLVQGLRVSYRPMLMDASMRGSPPQRRKKSRNSSFGLFSMGADDDSGGGGSASSEGGGAGAAARGRGSSSGAGSVNRTGASSVYRPPAVEDGELQEPSWLREDWEVRDREESGGAKLGESHKGVGRGRRVLTRDRCWMQMELRRRAGFPRGSSRRTGGGGAMDPSPGFILQFCCLCGRGVSQHKVLMSGFVLFLLADGYVVSHEDLSGPT